MKKFTLVLAAALVFTLALVPAVSAKPGGALKSDLSIALNWDWVGFPGGTTPCTWVGVVSGDINGDICVTSTGAWFPGNTQHFTELWTITTSDGEIEGVVQPKGVWRFANFKWVANGEVTGATGAWSDLIGSRWHYGGTTTTPFVAPPTPVTGTGALVISGS